MFSEHPKFVKYLWLNTPTVQSLLYHVTKQTFSKYINN